ncbi:MAG: UDP-glucose/GDP-mannose dehydrogenase family protein [Candidatus Marinimicrobia bacterium]|jgi:UDPglucose 6-dehydrogenase|nr:UDP-glucose/GDP-mannose dehydrogenase family protein [Candidatus Neomarinimicrobiota bacterium]MDP6789046.1 UDP-glucose/GDP-mannose dehydrogenase family protein [Candidatus Neomarinimicrobiota bacterium]MDP7072134.1 UDP-glucose/GDP-mannose dehydrogenase family protein [Candidatus Neomarinimicrobiota bacterium]
MKNITVIGTGYVGLVSGAGISDFGHQVSCVDIDESKIASLKKGEIPIYEQGLESLVKRNVDANRLTFSSDVSNAIKDADVVFIAVGTPQDDEGNADISAVLKVAETIGSSLNGYKVICTKSTVPIGTGRKVIEAINKTSGPSAQFDYVSNPEFLREGAAVRDFTHPDRVVIGADSQKAFDFMKDVYHPLYVNETPVLHTNIETAEMIKYACNAFLALKISYINEIANFCEEVGADVFNVAQGMGLDGRISPKFLHPGPGYGGSCFPKDTNALASQAEAAGVPLQTIRGAIDANGIQQNRMVQKLRRLMEGSFENKIIAVLGLSFKPQTDDIRESPAIPMIRSLLEEKASVKAFDPVSNDNMKSIFPNVEFLQDVNSAVADADAAVIMTDWNEFRGMDISRITSLMKTPIILDTRNILNTDELDSSGVIYDNVGRKKTNA